MSPQHSDKIVWMVIGMQRQRQSRAAHIRILQSSAKPGASRICAELSAREPDLMIGPRHFRCATARDGAALDKVQGALINLNSW